jgi:hypothetical protein
VTVVDPNGFVPVGGKVTVPFVLTDADIRADVLVLGEMAGAIQVEIIAPDATTLTVGAGAEEVARDAFRVVTVVPSSVLPPPSAAAARPRSVLSFSP